MPMEASSALTTPPIAERTLLAIRIHAKRLTHVAVLLSTTSCPASNPFRSARETLKTGIDMPQQSVDTLRQQTRDAIADLEGDVKILVYGCEHGLDANRLQRKDTAGIKLICSGMLPPTLVEFALKQGADETQLKRQIAMINSMTPAERRFPKTINGSRRKRIAAGSGLQVQDVNKLLKQFTQMEKMMKKMARGGMKKMLRGLPGGGLPPGMR